MLLNIFKSFLFVSLISISYAILILTYSFSWWSQWPACFQYLLHCALPLTLKFLFLLLHLKTKTNKQTKLPKSLLTSLWLSLLLLQALRCYMILWTAPPCPAHVPLVVVELHVSWFYWCLPWSLFVSSSPPTSLKSPCFSRSSSRSSSPSTLHTTQASSATITSITISVLTHGDGVYSFSPHLSSALIWNIQLPHRHLH